jgi:hypothetical protein
VADPGCEFKTDARAEPCGGVPTQIVTLGMTDPETPAGTGGYAGTVQYGHFCEEHEALMRQRMGEPD